MRASIDYQTAITATLKTELDEAMSKYDKESKQETEDQRADNATLQNSLDETVADYNTQAQHSSADQCVTIATDIDQEI